MIMDNEGMKVNELENKFFITPEDIMMAAVTHEVTENYVYKILSGARDTKSRKANLIVATLNKLSNINRKAANEKKVVVQTKQA